MLALGQRARQAAKAVREASAETRSAALAAMARHIRAAAPTILAANGEDMARSQAEGLSPAMLDRLKLDPARLEAMAAAVEDVAGQADLLGEVMVDWTRPNGLHMQRVRIPIGVIGIIYESRPNVTADAGALCLRSGNCVILRGGSDAIGSSMAITEALRAGLSEVGLPEDAIQLVPTTDRAAVGAMLAGLEGAIDMIIPRGGKSLVARVQNEARVPVLSHLEGICHTYIHQAADPDKAEALILNAKLRRTGVCGATETMLVDAAIAPSLLPRLAAALIAKGCELRGDAAARAIVAMGEANEQDWSTEYLAPILSVAIVAGIDAAVAHIGRYGSGHTDCIVTEDAVAAERFLHEVDSAIVLVNASTQYADGGEFGFGGEIGIGTGRLHARGPVGAEGLTTYKYVVRGTGQTRP
ncbi:gamma-glutamyl phosphate reductase [Candidatus Phycosocius bacilliformis]|uniref:Gamma-glutamyl phosphate reductase n=2 Tax=Candidatus Phycosocius bacilliformis TaxID=1445552 RepID=A0A2P2E9S6_9PROT|nr:gamma-glutamyl phosphate reductase [Candidatus Phycosocius bacilliformis]